MTEKDEDIKPLIEKINKPTVGSVATTGSVALLNLIPYVGGAVASVIGEIATKRRIEKVCDVLSNLESRLKEHGTNPDQHLSKDQIIEVVYETLQTVATTSDEVKITAIKNGLGYTFITDDAFERKQLFLQVLRGCTSLELVMLSAVYEMSDPYVIRENQPPISPVRSSVDPYLITSMGDVASMTLSGSWELIGNKDDCGPPLLTLFAKHIGFDESVSEGAVRLLDGKGLTSAGPNLNRTDGKILRWRSYDMNSITALGTYSSINLGFQEKPTPLEASRTKFGSDFLSFCRGEKSRV